MKCSTKLSGSLHIGGSPLPLPLAYSRDTAREGPTVPHLRIPVLCTGVARAQCSAAANQRLAGRLELLVSCAV